LPMKPFTIFDASITLSLSDVSDADHYFPSLLKRVFHWNDEYKLIWR
jgi:hypothetical protein